MFARNTTPVGALESSVAYRCRLAVDHRATTRLAGFSGFSKSNSDDQLSIIMCIEVRSDALSHTKYSLQREFMSFRDMWHSRPNSALFSHPRIQF